MLIHYVKIFWKNSVIRCLLMSKTPNIVSFFLKDFKCFLKKSIWVIENLELCFVSYFATQTLDTYQIFSPENFWKQLLEDFSVLTWLALTGFLDLETKKRKNFRSLKLYPCAKIVSPNIPLKFLDTEVEQSIMSYYKAGSRW